MELLAPAGSYEALVAAVQAGANAIYLGGQQFGARHYAANFSADELKSAVDYCHLHHVPIYITVNTLVRDDEIPALKKYLVELASLPVDAIIVQDLAVAKIAKEVAPILDIHGSTQMTVHNLEGAKALEKLGFSRVVLARELSLEEIGAICQGTTLEVEVFVHGALCVCYSGQCLMSSILGGRSGNRGKCAQPCRLPYQLEKDGKTVAHFSGEYLLSPKDLNFLDLLPDLKKAGVVSLKLEGRMKKPEYVATVVDAYRNGLDQKNENNLSKLESVFHRGFSQGYLKGVPGKSLMSSERPNNQGSCIGEVIRSKGFFAELNLTAPVAVGDLLEFRWNKEDRTIYTIKESDQCVKEGKGWKLQCSLRSEVPSAALVYRIFSSELTQWASQFYREGKEKRRIPITMTVSGKIGEKLHLILQDLDGNRVKVESEMDIQEAIKRPLTEEVLSAQLGRLGNTPYSMEQLILKLDGSIMVPMSELNRMRREGTEKLTNTRLEAYFRLKESNQSDNKHTKKLDFIGSNELPPKLVVQVSSIEHARAALAGDADGIYFTGDFLSDLKTAEEICWLTKDKGKHFILGLPRIIPEELKKNIWDKLALKAAEEADVWTVSHIGSLEFIKNMYPEKKVWGDFSLNIFNNEALQEYLENGISESLLSPELTLEQIKNITKNQGRGAQLTIHGYQELMVSKFCPLGSYLGGLGDGNLCSQPCLAGEYHLRDRKGEALPIQTDEFCQMHLFNGQELSTLPYIPELLDLGAATWRIDGRLIKPMKLKELVKTYKKEIKDKNAIRGREEERLLSGKVTRGHYYRGVE